MTSDVRGETTWLRDASLDDTKSIVEALYRVHRLFSAITDLNSLLVQIMIESKAVANAEACSLMLFDESSEELYFQVALGEKGDQGALIREVRLKLGQGIAGTTAQTRQSINVPDAQNDPRFYREADQASHFKTHSLLAVPMIDKDHLVGVIEVVNKVGGDSFTSTDLHVMEMFSSLAAAAVTNARLIEANLREERMAAIGQAVASMSHHTKNIITSMSGATDLMEQGMRDGNQAIMERAWPIMKRSTKRISNVVQDMLSYSKPRQPHLEPCNLGALIEDVRESFAELFAQKNVDIRIDTAALTGPVFADSQALHRCLFNLLTNAADAVPSQDGVVVIKAAPNESGGVVLDVADNGPGVPERIRRDIFEPFFSTKGSRGTGLGLAVSRKIALEHAGDLTVHDNPGGGALFRLTLPAPPPSLADTRRM